APDPDDPFAPCTPVVCSSVGASTIVEGFTITGARISGTSPHLGGTGIGLTSSQGIVRNNIITGNTGAVGGGIGVLVGAPTIIGNTIFQNVASGLGGGIYSSFSQALISRNIIFDNRAAHINPYAVGNGGGISASGSEHISECTIVGNHAERGAGLF